MNCDVQLRENVVTVKNKTITLPPKALVFILAKSSL